MTAARGVQRLVQAIVNTVARSSRAHHRQHLVTDDQGHVLAGAVDLGLHGAAQAKDLH